MVRKQCQGLNRGAWTNQEDKLLSDYIKDHGIGRWRTLPAKAGLNRCGKSCRLRWLNYLRPDIKRGNITEEEEELIIRLHKLLGNRWCLIAGRLPGRTDNEIKNYWNTYLRKKSNSSSSRSEHPNPPNSNKKAPSSTDQERECSSSGVVDVIRTKAVRCTRPLFADHQDPNYCGCPAELAPAVPVGPTFLPEFCGDVDLDVDGLCMESSVFMQAGAGPCEGSSNNMSCCSEHLHDHQIQGGEELYSFLDDVWDSFIMDQKI